jgi:hypothetical protein
MTITYQDVEKFNDAIYTFVVKGLTFKADGETLTITFTGGY